MRSASDLDIDIQLLLSIADVPAVAEVMEAAISEILRSWYAHTPFGDLRLFP